MQPSYNSQAFWKKNELFRNLKSAQFLTTQVIKSIAQKGSYIKHNDPYRVGRKKQSPTDSYLLTKNKDYQTLVCRTCKKQCTPKYLYHSCECHLCQDWNGCGGGDSYQIFFVCENCQNIKVISRQDERWIRYPEQVLRQQAEKKRRQFEEQQRKLQRQRQEIQEALNSQRKQSDFGQRRCSFGKHIGLKWKQIIKEDPSYITEFILSSRFKGKIKHQVRKWFSQI